MALEKVIERLLRTYPCFYVPVVEEAPEWIMENGSILLTVLFGNLAHFVKARLIDYEFDKMDEVFGLIEEFVAGEDAALSGAAATGFLEALVNMSGETFDSRLFVGMLGPHSKAYCLAWDKFTGVKTAGLYDSDT